MLRDVEVHDAPTKVGQHDHHEEQATRESRNGEEIHRRGRREMIREKRPPRLRPRARAMFQQTRDRALGDVDAERTQFSMNPRGAPQWVGGRHLANEGADLRLNRWTSICSLRAARPSAATPLAMPPNDSVGLHAKQCGAPVSPAPREDDPKEAVERPEPGALRRAV